MATVAVAFLGLMPGLPKVPFFALDLLDLLDPARGGSLMERVRALRKRIAADLGLVVPPVRTHDSHARQRSAPPSTYVVKLHGVEAARGAMWVRSELAELLATDGATVIDRTSVMVTHLSEVVRSAAPDLLTRRDVQILVDAVKTVSPVVVGEVGTDMAIRSAVLR